ncbi:hypothetical protein V1520DRAFT_366045 [Lipomyces starkeyi]|uniref:AttH domain-containing protein n=1 Tax=Lipomyces starkeyi NRRL Y-11557 TaxID=675824 RepID=A0A1E3QEH6_LIPST|nr:hypothetical protein LIPSTDRAFT_1430 [Lipomyces starkeyi NRRL Y-11557]
MSQKLTFTFTLQRSCYLLLLAISIVGSVASGLETSFVSVPLSPSNGSSIMVTTSSQGAFDGPKLSSVNSTSFDWWYFDICSEEASVQVIFFTGTPTAIGHASSIPLVTFATLHGLFPNGTEFDYEVPSVTVDIATDGDGSSGFFDGFGSWKATPDMSYYTITLDSEAIGIKGALYFQSAAPAHYPFNFAAERTNSTELFAPNFGWANAVPDADAHAHLTIGGTKLHIVGRGYHDKNWGDAPLPDISKTWYWGHAKIGPYAIVWFDYISYDGQEYYSGYLTKNAVPVSLGSSMTVRPYGRNETQYLYPPNASSTNPDGFIININAGYAGNFEFIASNDNIVQDIDGYTRWTGEITGGLVGGEQYYGPGVGLWEWMRFLS